jgi:hypothetical protein
MEAETWSGSVGDVSEGAECRAVWRKRVVVLRVRRKE